MLVHLFLMQTYPRPSQIPSGRKVSGRKEKERKKKGSIMPSLVATTSTHAVVDIYRYMLGDIYRYIVEDI